jgi:S1-C subfamily serine protease
MSTSSGLAWSTGKGFIVALRRADDLPGAGQGLRLLPFTPALSSGAGGGPLVGSQRALLGIVTKRIARGLGGASAEAGFAVPIETVIGLADGSGKQALGSAAALEMPASHSSPSTAVVIASRAQDVLRTPQRLHMAQRFE